MTNSANVLEDVAGQGWNEDTRNVRRNRRPKGWLTTPEQLRERRSRREPEAISTLCRLYRNLVRAYLQQRFGASEVDAEEGTQACFTRLLNGKKLSQLELDPTVSFGGWLARQAKFALLNHWTDERRYKQPVIETRGVGLSDSSAVEQDPRGAKVAREQEERERHHGLLLFQERSLAERNRFNLAPDYLLDEEHALDLLERAFARLQPEYEARGEAALFTYLKSTLCEETKVDDARLCDGFGFSDAQGVTGARYRLKWKELPAAIRELDEEDRLARSKPSARARLRILKSSSDGLRALVDVLSA